MTGEDFLRLASELFARSRAPSEAMSRTIASRAYYGAFHIARDYVESLGFPDFEHRALADCLIASGDVNVIRAGDMLRDLAAGRRRADYDLTNVRVVSEVRDSAYIKDFIERSYDVKALLDQSAAAEARSRVKAGIEAWRRRGGKANP